MRTFKIISILFLSIICASVVHSSKDATFKVVGSKTASAGILSTDVQIAFEVLFNDLLIKTGEKVELTVYDDFNKVESLFVKDQDYSAFYCSSVEFLQSEMVDLVEEDSLFAAAYNGYTARKILLVVKKDSAINSLDNLFNKNITYGHSSDLIELYLNTIAINSRSMLAKEYFQTISNKLNGSESLVSLYFGNTDVAAVYDHEYELAIELNPQLKDDLIVLEESPYLINALVGIRKEGVENDTRNLFRMVALEMHKNKKGQKMLTMYGAEKFDVVAHQDLMSVKKMLDTYKRHLEK